MIIALNILIKNSEIKIPKSEIKYVSPCFQ